MQTKKRVVVVGGGTGTHTVLRGLRRYTDIVQLSAVVSMADSGGSTGRLRDEFGLLPIGDVRNALTALASEGDEYDALLRQLFLYRFEKGEGLSGHNFGNLFLTALSDILGSEVKAIEATSRILKVAGRVIPVTTDDVELVAYYDDLIVVGEDNIEKAKDCASNSRIRALSLDPSATITSSASETLKQADLIVLGPGDLYTSILPNVIVDGFRQAVSLSQAKVVYVCNLMSKKGQTIGMNAKEHIAEIGKYLGRLPDVVLINSEPLPESLVERYLAEADQPVINNCQGDECTIASMPLISHEEVIKQNGDVVRRSLIRHDSDLLAKALVMLL